MKIYDKGREFEKAFRMPSESDIANAGAALEQQDAAEPLWEPERIEIADTPEQATMLSLCELMVDACGKEMFALDHVLPLHALSAKLMDLGYARTGPYSREGLLAALQDGAYVLLYLPDFYRKNTDDIRLESGGSYACRVLRADEDWIVLKDHLSGTVKEVSHETVAFKHPGAQILEVYK